MSIKTYSLKKHGSTKLSEHFYLEKIRAHFGKPVRITSGYRSPAYNAKVGGVKNSYHVKGMAADIVIDGVKSKEVAQYAETIGCGGIGWYEARNFTHIDTRSGCVRWKNPQKQFGSAQRATMSNGCNGISISWEKSSL